MFSKALAAINDELQIPVHDRLPLLALQLSGTFASAACAFEGRIDPAGAWVPIEAVRNNINTIETSTGTLSAAPAYTWDLSVAGFSQVRVRCTAIASGSMTWFAQQYENTNDVCPAVPSHSITGLPTPTATMHNSLATTNPVSAATSARTLHGVSASNTAATSRYLKLYNKASAPTVGTDIPVLTIHLPAGTTTVVSFGMLGLRFGTGLAFAITAGAADTDTAAILAGEVKAVLSYVS